ncbi:MAG TPA: undecaprenyl-phosphate glucose phosphotransferase [Kaistiaceae bacterium]|nr:undecaprenyl-phosphate glucose phosphotransferase [Kaistiaceae bacterium]
MLIDTKEAFRNELRSGTAATPQEEVRRRERTRPLGPKALEIIREPVGEPVSRVVLTGMVRIGDFVLTALVGALVYGVYLYGSLGFDGLYMALLLAAPATTVLLLQALNAYRVNQFRSIARQSARIAAAWTGVFGLVLTTLFFLKAGAEVSRLWLGVWYVAGLAALVGARVGLYGLVRGWTQAGRLQQRAAIVGGGEAAEKLIADLEASNEHDIRICGVFDDRGDERSSDMIGGYPKLGNVDDLVEFARHTRIDLLIVTIPMTAEARVLQMLKKLWVLPADIRMSAHTNKLRLHRRAYSYIGNVPFLDVFDRPIADWDVIVKAVFDRVVGAAMLVAFAPVMAAVALAVKLESKGPVFFKQRRHGFNNELIAVYKFRSMYTDRCDTNAAKLVTKDDPRVTRVGKFIRKTSLDELPQLFNVVKGELSLVGPRPHATQAKADNQLYKDVVDGYYARHKVKPGITGWAQINGWRGETDTADKIQGRVEHDLYYIENWSILFDLYILVMTPVSLMSKSENAY